MPANICTPIIANINQNAAQMTNELNNVWICRAIVVAIICKEKNKQIVITWRKKGNIVSDVDGRKTFDWKTEQAETSERKKSMHIFTLTDCRVLNWLYWPDCAPLYNWANKGKACGYKITIDFFFIFVRSLMKQQKLLKSSFVKKKLKATEGIANKLMAHQILVASNQYGFNKTEWQYRFQWAFIHMQCIMAYARILIFHQHVNNIRLTFCIVRLSCVHFPLLPTISNNRNLSFSKWIFSLLLFFAFFSLMFLYVKNIMHEQNWNWYKESWHNDEINRGLKISAR